MVLNRTINVIIVLDTLADWLIDFLEYLMFLSDQY